MRVVTLSLLAAAGCLTSAPTDPTTDDGAPTKSFSDAQKASKSGPSPVVDHGGLVLSASKTVAIYWGPSAAFPSDLQTGMAALLGGFTGSSYLGIADQYMRGAAISTSYAGALTDTSTPPKSAPNAAALAAEACKASNGAALDPDALYIVFTSNAPNINYCAWHNKASVTCNGVTTTIQVAYVPNQADLPGCSPYTKSNLGCNTYSDGTVTTADSVAHEFMETITDAHIDAWYDANHAEVGDKCNYNYQACVDLGAVGGSWQIQSIWSNAISGCQQ